MADAKTTSRVAAIRNEITELAVKADEKRKERSAAEKAAREYDKRIEKLKDELILAMSGQ